jgi:hypothetical protein
MKKLLLKLWRFLNSIFLQSLLLWVAIFSWDELHGGDDFGKALGMGLVTCMCIFGVVWLQINKTKP